MLFSYKIPINLIVSVINPFQSFSSEYLGPRERELCPRSRLRTKDKSRNKKKRYRTENSGLIEWRLEWEPRRISVSPTTLLNRLPLFRDRSSIYLLNFIGTRRSALHGANLFWLFVRCSLSQLFLFCSRLHVNPTSWTGGEEKYIFFEIPKIRVETERMQYIPREWTEKKSSVERGSDDDIHSRRLRIL